MEMLKRLARLRFVYVYVLLIPLVNWSFAHVPNIALGGGGVWQPLAIVTGLVLVFRDFAQREIGHLIFIPLLIGVAISFVMAPPAIALASALAFGISEAVDWAVYTASKRPLSQRVLISSAIAAPLDSAVFLIGADQVVPGVLNEITLLTSIASKILGAWILFRILRRRERRIGV
jgi:hypothetical protein